MSVIAPVRNSAYEVTNPSPPISDFNSGGSDDYRDKFENLKILVNEQQKQIKSQRAQEENGAIWYVGRNDETNKLCEVLDDGTTNNLQQYIISILPQFLQHGYTKREKAAAYQQEWEAAEDALRTINACLVEKRSENADLSKQIKKFHCIVTVLRERLVANGLSVEVVAGDPEVVAPSKQLLLEENLKLQEKLKYLQVDPAKLEQLYKAKQHLEAELQKRVRAIEHLSADNDHLRATLIASSDVKDTTIIRLQCQRETLRVNQDTQDVICQSLSDETVTLKERLRATAEVCQHLVRQLERKLPGGMPLSLDQLTMSTSNEGSLVVENERLRLENMEKGEEIKKLVEMNANWQRYNDARTGEMAVLEQQLEAGKTQVEGMTLQLSREQQQEMDRLMLQHKQKADVAEEAKMKVESDNRRLRTSVDLYGRQLQDKDSLISSLRQQVQALADANIQQATPSHDNTQIVHLEAQLKVYQEDFECERRDREAAQTKISELENELSLVTRQLEQFQGVYLQRLQHERQSALTNHENTFHMEQQQIGSHHPLVARGSPYQCDTPVNIEEDGIDEVDTPGALASPPEQRLQCPMCKKEFPISRHNDLLEHIDECCD